MKALYTFLKDLKIAFRTFYIYIELVLAVIFIAVLLFVIPENFNQTRTVFTAHDLEGAAKTFIEKELQASEDDIVMLGSRDEIVSAMSEDRSSVGMLISRENDKFFYEFVLQGYESDQLVKILERTFLGSIASEMPGFEDKITMTTLEGTREKLSDRLTMLPVFLVMNSAFTGLFIVAAYIFMDKDEGTIRALTVTPAKVSDYLLSKLGIMLLTGLMTGLLTAAAVAGTHIHYGHMIFLLIVSNLFGTALGLVIASFFDTITKAMGWIFVVVIVLAFSTTSYYLPSFSPWIIRALPSYPMLFAFRETLYNRPDVGYIYTAGSALLAATAALFLFAVYRFKKTLTV